MLLKPQMKSCVPLILTLTLSACSVKPTGSATLNATIDALGDTLPTASINDTEQTQREIATHRLVFLGICEDVKGQPCAPSQGGS